MKDDKTVSKSIRFPRALLERMDRAAKENGSSFSATVIDMLEHGAVVVIPEGREIAALLFEINHLLCEGLAADSCGIRAAIERLVEVIWEVSERYLEGSKDNGDR